MATPWKNYSFILSDRSDFHVVDNLSIVFHALPMHLLTSLSVVEILLPRYMNWSSNFQGLPFRTSPFWFNHMNSRCLLQAMQQRYTYLNIFSWNVFKDINILSHSFSLQWESNYNSENLYQRKIKTKKEICCKQCQKIYFGVNNVERLVSVL